MLRIVKNMRDLSFGALMEVYRESNTENGMEFWPEEAPWRQLQLAEERFYEYLRYDFFSAPGSFYALWEVAGKPMSALRLEPYRDGMLMEAQETHPAYRRMGYAARMIRAVQEACPNVKIYSHVGKRNKASLITHERCGFRRISDQAVYADGSVNSRSYTLCWEGKK